jgi:hypothetical protein
LIVQFQDDSKTFWGIAKLDAGELGELVSIFNSPSGPNAIIDQLSGLRLTSLRMRVSQLVDPVVKHKLCGGYHGDMYQQNRDVYVDDYCFPAPE